MEKRRIWAPKIPIRAAVFRQQFSMAKVYRKAQALFIKKNLAPLNQSKPFLSTTSRSFRITVQSRKTATMAVSGNRAFVAEWEPTG